MSMYDKKEPYAIDVKAGESVWICTCNHTGNPPFCDGSHSDVAGAKGPTEHKAEQDETVYFCGCGKSKNGIYCDGSHSQ